MENNEQIVKQIEDWVFTGINYYYRDTPLNEEQLSAYQEGQILRAGNFIDATNNASGVTGPTRYLIASSKAAAFYNIEPLNTEAVSRKQFVFNVNSYFKVLDVYTVGGKTQITLLHIPRAWVDARPSGGMIGLDETSVKDQARLDFDDKVYRQSLPILEEVEWRLKVQYPIGIDQNGIPLNLERSEELMSLPLFDSIKQEVNDMSGLDN